MRKQPRLHYKSYLAHSRPVGSRNGFSTIPGYIPRGKKAVGIKQPDGSYLYLEPGAHPELARGAVAAGQIRQQQFQNSNVAKNLPSVTDLQRQHGQSYVNAREQQQRQGSAINAKAGRLANQRAQGQSYVNAREEQQRQGSAINTQLAREAQARANTIPGRIKSAGYNVGKWLNTSRQNVTNWFNQTGDNIRNNNVVKNIGNTARNIYNRVGEAWDGKAGSGSAKDLANAARTNASMYKKYAERDPNNSARYSAYTKARTNQLREASKQDALYNKSIVGRLDNATKGIRNVIGGALNRNTDNTREQNTKLINPKEIQTNKNTISQAGGREAAQAKGNAQHMKNINRQKAEYEANKKKAEQNFTLAQTNLKRFDDEINKYGWFDSRRSAAIKKKNKYINEVYNPAKQAWDRYNK